MQGSSVVLLGLRALRGPLIAIVAIFAVGIVGLVLLPGVHPDGSRWHMTFAEALYFMSYTATTIGFGEVPQTFTPAQRLWVTAIIFASVIGWAYLVGTVLAMTRDEAFRGALSAARVTRAIRALREPFYLICGFGETGLLVGRALDRLGTRFVVVDIDGARIQEVKLLDLAQEVPAVHGDARLPATLLRAGLARSNCQGVLALTNDDQANLAAAMAVRLLNPNRPVLARAMSREVEANMASFGTDQVVNPFALFGSYLALALAAPASYRLASWLTALPGSQFEMHMAPPQGHWVVCGYGRFGREVVKAFRDQGLDVCIVDPEEPRLRGIQSIRGTGTEAEPLVAAGIRDAVGIVAGTDDDITNLSIAVTAREVNEGLFTIVRQNLQSSTPLFDAFDANVTMVSSSIIANECLAVIKTPRLKEFLEFARIQDDEWAERVLERLSGVMGNEVPELWSVPITIEQSPAALQAVEEEGLTVTLEDLLRDPGDRERPLQILPLARFRAGALLALPETREEIRAGDQLLFAGTPPARSAQRIVLRNANTCRYVLTGTDAPSGWIWQTIRGRSGAGGKRSA
ncbi:MAG: NAD-binding protein [Gammaproteobacteria bacterium]|nr:NAD-binding protein [Gammaproteobacteria bacterium]